MDSRGLPQTMSESPWILDVDATSFASDVVERSQSVPVVLDFWATWCEPCRTLGPALEELARRHEGRFVLAKVDIDHNRELAQAFRIESVPTVIAIVEGRPVDGFMGVLPPAELEAFLDRIAPGGGTASGPVDEAQALAAAGDVDGAVVLLRTHLEQSEDVEARITLAHLLLEADRGSEAQAELDRLDEAQAEHPEVKALRTRLAFLENAGDLEERRAAVAERPEDPAAHLELGTALCATEAYAEALEHLLTSVRLAPEHEEGAAKSKMLEIFDLLGLEDPVANDYRFKLSLELFS